MRSVPVRTRLTLAAIAAFTVALTVVGVVVVVLFAADLRRTVDAGLRSRAEALFDVGPDAVSPDRRLALVDVEDAFAQRYDADGTLVATSAGIPGTPLVGAGVVRALGGPRLFDVDVRTPEGELVPARVLVAPAREASYVLLVGSSVEDEREAVQHLAILLALGGIVSLAVVSALTWRVLGRALAPVEAMRAEASAISASEPGRRLPVPPADDELARLAGTLNAMLDRLEEALARERHLVADASHELRTPLTNLKAELDLALRRARTSDELEAALRSAGEETDRLVRLAEDLLALARLEDGRLPLRLEDADVVEIATRTVGSFEPRAAERGVELELDAPRTAPARVDPMRLAQALGNLLDNALRATPPAGRVAVSVEASAEGVSIAVEDTGPGFDPAVAQRLFEPFSQGSGLGLAIVRAVAESHGGRVSVGRSSGGGARLVVEMAVRERGAGAT